ncbi:hypothetical protein MUK42_22926 [Musa troglodytarum]|uniref:Uncharacterized protein n=1 Tax=Musa troglodytarum TaxID=320322 RepID=A0A9E7L5X5_9LILI|nr:hypothetical protein MUK42_22926 [Musa troglodytarum]
MLLSLSEFSVNSDNTFAIRFRFLVKAVEAPGTETRFSDCFFGPLFQAQHMRFRQRPAPELAFGQEMPL